MRGSRSPSTRAPTPASGRRRRRHSRRPSCCCWRRCGPEHRAAYVLREAFDYPYEEVAEILATTPSNARQLREPRQEARSQSARKEPVDGNRHKVLLQAFVAAARDGDLRRLEAVLSADVVSTSDGAGLAPRAARHPVVGRDKVSRFVAGWADWWAGDRGSRGWRPTVDPPCWSPGGDGPGPARGQHVHRGHRPAVLGDGARQAVPESAAEERAEGVSQIRRLSGQEWQRRVRLRSPSAGKVHPMKVVVIGGTGLIGSKLVDKLTMLGHEAVPAAPQTGVNTPDRRGPRRRPGRRGRRGRRLELAVVRRRRRHALLHDLHRQPARRGSGGRGQHHVALSVVGTGTLPDSGYLRAKAAQEDLIRRSGSPTRSCTRPSSSSSPTPSRTRRPSTAPCTSPRCTTSRSPPTTSRPRSPGWPRVAPSTGSMEVAGPDRVRMDEFIVAALRTSGDTPTGRGRRACPLLRDRARRRQPRPGARGPAGPRRTRRGSRSPREPVDDPRVTERETARTPTNSAVFLQALQGPDKDRQILSSVVRIFTSVSPCGGTSPGFARRTVTRSDAFTMRTGLASGRNPSRDAQPHHTRA